MKKLTAVLSAAAMFGLGAAASQAQTRLSPRQQQQQDQLIAIEAAVDEARQQVAAGASPARVRIFQGPQKKEKAAFLGVVAAPVQPAVREQLKLKKGVGLTVEAVEKDSPAEQAGLKQYDVIQQIDDQWLVDAHQLAVVVRMHQPGEEVKLSVIRQGQPVTMSAKLVERELPELDATSVWRMPGGGEPFGDPFVVPDGSMILRGPMKADVDELLAKMNANGDAMTLSMNDEEHTLTLTVRDGHKHLTAVDRDGNIVFNGAIDSDEQRKAVPEKLRNKLERLESKPGTIRFKLGRATATRPAAEPTQP